MISLIFFIFIIEACSNIHLSSDEYIEITKSYDTNINSNVNNIIINIKKIEYYKEIRNKDYDLNEFKTSNNENALYYGIKLHYTLNWEDSAYTLMQTDNGIVCDSIYVSPTWDFRTCDDKNWSARRYYLDEQIQVFDDKKKYATLVSDISFPQELMTTNRLPCKYIYKLCFLEETPLNPKELFILPIAISIDDFIW